MNLADVIAFLDEQRAAIFDAGIFHQDEYGTHSATADDALELEVAAEALRDIRHLLCGEAGDS